VDDGGKRVKFTGVPLRAMLAEMIPQFKLETMAQWKALARQELVMEVTGDDGYPGLVTALELAINTSGDRLVLATLCDGKPLDSAVQLICKMDEERVRWVRQIVSKK
jgi:hypothetical protein